MKNGTIKEAVLSYIDEDNYAERIIDNMLDNQYQRWKDAQEDLYSFEDELDEEYEEWLDKPCKDCGFKKQHCICGDIESLNCK